MPKTTTAAKMAKKSSKSPSKPRSKTASKKSSELQKAFAHVPDPSIAQKEFKQRKKSQLAMIRKTDKKLLAEMLYQMVLGRVFEQKCAEVYRIGMIGGFCHLYIGQEAIAIGSMMALKEGDYTITSYRDHVQAMVAGIAPEEVLAELYGRAGGNVKGKGGSMHMFSKEKGFFG